jgi:translocation and assembly module TamB
MTPSQEPESDQWASDQQTQAEPPPEPGSPRPGKRSLVLGLTVMVGLLAVGTAAGVAGWVWSRDRLLPWLAAELTEVLGRPVELGPLERLGPTGIRVGPSIIPPTATDPDTLALEAVELSFSLLDLWRRELPLHLTLDRGHLYLEQNAEGEWFDLDINLPDRDHDRDPWVDIRVDSLAVRDGRLTMVPYGAEDADPVRVAIADIRGQIEFRDALVEVPDDPDSPLETRQIDINLRGRSHQGGRLDVRGAVLLPPPQDQPTASADATEVPGPGLQANITMRTQAARAADIMPLVDSFLADPLPVQFPTGLVSGQVDIQSGRGVPVTIVGTARVTEATMVTPGLPEPIENLEGNVLFRAREIEYEAVTASLGPLTAAGGGILNFDTGYALNAQINPFTAAQLTDWLEVTLPVTTAGTFRANVAMTGPLNQPVIATELLSQGTVVVDRVPLSDLRVNTTLRAPTLTVDRFQVIPQPGGAIAGSGQFTFGQAGQPSQLALAFQGDRLPATALGQLYGLSPNVDLGLVSLDGELAGPVGQLVGTARWRAPAGDFPAQGSLALEDNTLRFTDTFVQVAGGTVAGTGTLGLGDRRWQADLRALDLQLGQMGAGVAGSLTGTGQFGGRLGPGALENLQGQATGQALLAGGDINARATVDQGRWVADLQANELQLQDLSPDLRGTAGGRFRLTGRADNLTLAGVRGQGQIGLSDGLAALVPGAPPLALVRDPLVADLAWDGRSVQVQRATTAGLTASGVITPRLGGAGGPAIANLDLNLTADGVNLAALPLPEVVPLQGQADFTGRLRGRPGALTLTGDASLVGLTAAGLAFASPLSGPVAFTQGGPVAIDLTGRGQNRIYVAPVPGPGRGDRDLDFEILNDFNDPTRPTALAQGSIRGDELIATLENFPLTDLRLPRAELGGVGTLSGTVNEATIVANLRQSTLRASFDIEDPGVGYLRLPTATVPSTTDPTAAPDAARPVVALETRFSQLRGTVTFAEGVVNLAGVTLDSAPGCAPLPVEPSTALGGIPPVAASPLCSRYLVSGTYTLGPEPQINGNLTVQNGQIQDLLQTLRIFELADLRPNLLRPPEWYRPPTPAELASLEQVSPVGDPSSTLLDQLRRLAEVRELQDILAAEAEAAPLPPLEELTGRFSGTVTAQGRIPQDLEIAFDLRGAGWQWGDPTQHANGVAYRFDEVIARGNFAENVLRLNPVSVTSTFNGFSTTTPNGVALATLNGDVSFDPDDPVARTLRLEVSNVPLQAVRQPLRLPSNLDGLLNLGATLTGSLATPQVRGQLAVNEATINRNAIDLATATFSYQEARLNLISRLAVDEQIDPLRLRASLPLPLPGVDQQPASDTVDIALRLQDDGFALVNLLTQAFVWEGGDASLALDVQGRWPVNRPLQEALSTLTVTGGATFEGVTISSRNLPEPLTNIQGAIAVVEEPRGGPSGSVYSSGLVLDFQNLRGDFSQGKVLAQGGLKLLPSVRDLTPGLFDSGGAPFAAASPGLTPFRLTLDNIALDLRHPAGTYRGRVDGDVRVGGSIFLLPPVVSGVVQLSQGVLTLPEADENDTATTTTFVSTREPTIFEPLPPSLENFQLVLANNVRLAIPGIVDVRAEGSLDLVGTAPTIRPNGRINLPAGRVNLLTTEFRLTGDENYAEFSDLDATIDPYLVANLSAAVPDSAAAGNVLAVATPFPRNEISVSRIDQLGLTQTGVQTVRIRATVNGRASRVANLQGVELTSTPPRSEGEIVALISGGLLAALESTLGSVSGGGDSFQGLLAFAGSALLNNLQNLLGEGLDRTELRLFSASPPGGQQGGAIDIGGEIGFNFSPNISVSVQKVFTNVSPALLNVRYRITDQITLRAITSYEQFNENTGAVLEFRF